MSGESLPPLDSAQLADLQTVYDWLSVESFQSTPLLVDPEMETELIIAVGGALLDIPRKAAERLRDGKGSKILTTGGIGHSTALLWKAVDATASLHLIAGEELAEAQVYAHYLREVQGVPAEDVLVEDQSTNCGANAQLSKRLLDELGWKPKQITLIQDPTMQIRTALSFQRAYRGEQVPIIVGSVPFRATFVPGGPFAIHTEGADHPIWEPLRLLQLVLGEIPRLRSYGPDGSDFIEHIDIPAAVSEAHERLSLAFGEHTRTA